MSASNSEINLKRGDILYREGDANDAAYIIDEGKVILHRLDADQRVDLEMRGHGAVIGEFSILTDQPRTVTAQAHTDCRIMRLPADKIFERFEHLDPVLKACVETSISFTAKLNAHMAGLRHPCELVRHAPPVPAELIERLRLGNNIAPGLLQDEFSMVYQPIVQLADESIVGFEALMRWTHPTLGNVAPDRFIQVAEDLETIAPLTEFALTEACATLARMHRIAPDLADLYMSINVSGADIGRVGFPDFVAHVLDLNGLDPRHIRLEVTETSLVPSSDAAEMNLDCLQSRGIGISVDDFGTGYSNLGYLKNLPLTALKIDRAFAGDAHSNAVSQSIVRMLVTLGRELGVDIIAEGLETVESANLLRDLGCRLAQGYQFFKPLPVADAFKLLSSGPDNLQQPA